ncbi:UNVERIFIED_CONTAM: Cyclin-dependent-like kinase 5, partial [Eudyptes robustus]
ANTGKPLFCGNNVTDQLRLIFRVTGVPSEYSWPGVTKLPDYKPIVPFSPSITLDEAVPRLDASGLSLLKKMLVCNPSERISAQSALEHPFL